MIAALGAVLLVLGVSAWSYDRLYRGRVLPGVEVAGVELGGLDEQEAAQRIATDLPGAAPVVTLLDVEDGRGFEVAPEAIGLPWSAGYLAALAIEAGREGLPWRPITILLRGHDVAATLRLNEAGAAAGLTALAPEVDQAPRNAAVELVDGRLVETEAEPGKQLDVSASLQRLREAVRRPDIVPVLLETTQTSPRVFDDEGVGEAYRLATNKPLRLQWRDGRSWDVTTDTLRSWYTVEQRRNDEGDETPFILVDRAAVERFVAPLEDELRQAPRDARFQSGAEGVVVREIESPGLELDVEATIDRLIEAAYWDGRVVEPIVAVQRPSLTRNVAAQLQGLRDRAHAATSLAGLPPEQQLVLAAAATRLDGIALLDGMRFSFLDALGPTANEEAFAAAWASRDAMDQGGWLLGGMEQMATSAFRAALTAGLLIEERHAPPWRSGWLEPPVGLDAAVAPARDGQPARDLVFINDSGGPILLTVSLDTQRGALIWTVHAMPTTWTVRLDGPVIGDVSEPSDDSRWPTAFLPLGTLRQVAWARSGGTTQWVRTVLDGTGAAQRSDTIESTYPATGTRVLVGTEAPNAAVPTADPGTP